MNISWILCGLTALVTGVGRSFGYQSNLEPLLVSSEGAIQTWFPLIWFTISGLFLFAAIVFLAIGLKPNKLASTQIATLFTLLFAITWTIIAAFNFGSSEPSTVRPLYPIGVIVLLGAYGIYRDRTRAQ